PNPHPKPADVVLVSVGRRPYVEGLGLESVGVKLDAKGRVAVDDHFRTNVPRYDLMCCFCKCQDVKMHAKMVCVFVRPQVTSLLMMMITYVPMCCSRGIPGYVSLILSLGIFVCVCVCVCVCERGRVAINDHANEGN